MSQQMPPAQMLLQCQEPHAQRPYSQVTLVTSGIISCFDAFQMNVQRSPG